MSRIPIGRIRGAQPGLVRQDVVQRYVRAWRKHDVATTQKLLQQLNSSEVATAVVRLSTEEGGGR